MDCSRHPRRAPLALARLVAIFLLTPSVSACAVDESQLPRPAAAVEPHVPRPFNNTPIAQPVGSVYDTATRTAIGRPRAHGYEASRGHSARRHTASDVYPVQGTNPRQRGCRPSPLLILGAATVLLLLAWRGPTSTQGKRVTPAASPHSVVCLACRRCSRVVDVPRERLSRQLFCPRCGSTLQRDA
jgi:hypothetical protein